MKIAIATDLYTPMSNGIATFARNLAVGLQKRGHEVIVLAPSTTGELGYEYEEGVQVVRLPSMKFPFYPDQISEIPEAREIFGRKIPRLAYRHGLHVSWWPYPEIREALDEFRPDVIHTQTPGPIGLAVLRYARRHDVALVSTGHAYPDNITSQVRLPKSVKRGVDEVVRRYFAGFLEKAEYATMPTQMAIQDIALRGKRRSFKVSIRAISNGIDLSRFSPGKPQEETYERFGIPRDQEIIGFVGRIDREKSLDVLLTAFARMAPTRPRARLVIVGDGKDADRLEKLADDLEVADKVVFTGAIERGDLPDVYRTFDVFAITSETETQGIVIMEAMASGVGVVAVRAGAVGDIVKNNKTGFLKRPRDVRGIADSLAAMLKYPVKRRQLIAGAHKILEQHDINHTLEEFEQIYRQVSRRAG
jgi:glycosyltransferase involved in cell wall biosynthesis